MLPERLLRFEIEGGALVARYLLAEDEAWLATLLEVLRENAARSRRDLGGLLRDALPPASPREAVQLAMHVLLATCTVTATGTGTSGRAVRPAPTPRIARRETFAERGRSQASRDVVLRTVAERLALTADELESLLLADLPSERRVGTLPPDLSARDARALVNLRLAQGLVARAGAVVLDLEGHVRRVVQQATWQGLLCQVRGEDPERCRLEVSGPLAVLHATRLYSKALASLVPVLGWCRRFTLDAACRVRGRELAFRLDDRDPIGRGTPPRRHDSRIEEAFEADVRRLAPEWDVVREPQALSVAGTIVFPDFALGPGGDPRARVLVEIVGWWTREYLETKLARLRAARCDRLILCLEERAGRGAGSLDGLDVLRFRRRVDALRVIERARAMLGRSWS